MQTFCQNSNNFWRLLFCNMLQNLYSARCGSNAVWLHGLLLGDP